jgi:periplasmic protein TonB
MGIPMNTHAHPKPRLPLAALLAAMLALGLSACSDEEPAAPAAPAAGTQPAAPAAAPAAEPAAPPVELPEDEGELTKRADAAVDSQQLFAPQGANAFELYLKVVEVNPENTFAKNAISDLFPYAVMHVEQRLAANDTAEAARVLALMEKANDKAPAMPRLRTALQSASERAARQLAEEEARAEREAAAAAAAAQQAATPTPAPVVATPPPATTAPPAAQPTPPPAAVVEPEAPAPAPVAATPRAGQLPPVVSQVSPRYPPLALRRRIEGFVELSFTVQPDGRVTDISVIDSEPRTLFNREAINAMERWRFAPSSAPVKGRRTFDFKLADE